MFLYIYEGYVIHLVKYKLGTKIKKRIKFSSIKFSVKFWCYTWRHSLKKRFFQWPKSIRGLNQQSLYTIRWSMNFHEWNLFCKCSCRNGKITPHHTRQLYWTLNALVDHGSLTKWEPLMDKFQRKSNKKPFDSWIKGKIL